MKLALVALVALSACTPAVAGEYQRGYAHERTCFKSEYREEYIPGTENDPGYVKSWKETIEVPCEDTPTHHHDGHLYHLSKMHLPTNQIFETQN